MYNADTMHSFLGSEGTDEQAQIFARYLLNHGWELVENVDGEEMTELEWQATLLECFR